VGSTEAFFVGVEGVVGAPGRFAGGVEIVAGAEEAFSEARF